MIHDNSMPHSPETTMKNASGFLKASSQILQTYDATKKVKNVYINEVENRSNNANKPKKKRIIVIHKKKHRDGSISKER